MPAVGGSAFGGNATPTNTPYLLVVADSLDLAKDSGFPAGFRGDSTGTERISACHCEESRARGGADEAIS